MNARFLSFLPALAFHTAPQLPESRSAPACSHDLAGRGRSQGARPFTEDNNMGCCSDKMEPIEMDSCCTPRDTVQRAAQSMRETGCR